LIGGMVVAGLALGMGGIWWASLSGVNFMTAPAPRPRVAATVPAAPENAAIPQLATNTRVAAPAYHPYQPPPMRAATDSGPAENVPAETQRQPQTTAEPDAADAPEAPNAATDAVEAAAPVQEKAEAKPARPSRNASTREARKRPPPVAKQERNEEIDRLRTQAFSETRKDRVDRINRPKDPTKLPISSARSARLYASTRRAFSECDRSANILRREQCRWQVCGGKWGRHGCPSYEQMQASIN
jgi:hypothetical protein